MFRIQKHFHIRRKRPLACLLTKEVVCIEMQTFSIKEETVRLSAERGDNLVCHRIPLNIWLQSLSLSVLAPIHKLLFFNEATTKHNLQN